MPVFGSGAFTVKAAAKYPYAPEVIPALESVLADGRIANW
jgi:galactonate dehydratase